MCVRFRDVATTAAAAAAASIVLFSHDVTESLVQFLSARHRPSCISFRPSFGIFYNFYYFIHVFSGALLSANCLYIYSSLIISTEK